MVDHDLTSYDPQRQPVRVRPNKSNIRKGVFFFVLVVDSEPTRAHTHHMQNTPTEIFEAFATAQASIVAAAAADVRASHGWVLASARDQRAAQRAIPARANYQSNFVAGIENLSGSTLKGTASKRGAKYAESRRSAIATLRAAGIPTSETKGPNNRRVLVVGATAIALLALGAI